MKYRGVEITAEVQSYDMWSIDEDGKLDDWLHGNDGVEISGYSIEGNGLNEFVTSPKMSGDALRSMIDDMLEENKVKEVNNG